MIRIIVCDDHPIVLSGLIGVFRDARDIEVVASCVTGEEALVMARQLQPDVMVVDLRMGTMSGLDIVRELNHDGNPVQVVLISGELSDDDTVEALRTGVRGILLKEMAPHQIVDCVRSVHAGRRWLDTRASGRAIERLLRQEASTTAFAKTLTPRELELTRLVGMGLRNKDIASRLSIGEGTVKTHLFNVFRKLGVESRVELVLLAREKHLV